MNDLMSSVSSQIQRAISETINEQVLLQNQTTLRSGQGQVPGRRWEVPGRKPECRSEEALNRIFRSSSRDEFPRDFNRNEHQENTHYKCFSFSHPEASTCLQMYRKSFWCTMQLFSLLFLPKLRSIFSRDEAFWGA